MVTQTQHEQLGRRTLIEEPTTIDDDEESVLEFLTDHHYRPSATENDEEGPLRNEVPPPPQGSGTSVASIWTTTQVENQSTGGGTKVQVQAQGRDQTQGRNLEVHHASGTYNQQGSEIMGEGYEDTPRANSSSIFYTEPSSGDPRRPRSRSGRVSNPLNDIHARARRQSVSTFQSPSPRSVDRAEKLANEAVKDYNTAMNVIQRHGGATPAPMSKTYLLSKRLQRTV